MKPHSADEKAAVLIFAVLLLAAGVFVLTGIAQLAATQALVGQREWDVLQQRVTLENSRAMARQFMLARMISNVVPTNAVGYTNADLGGFSISNVAGPSSGLYWSYATTNAGQVINPFNPMERGGFYAGVARAQLVSDIASTNVASWTFLVRTRSPIAAGYSFVQQQPVIRTFAPNDTRYVDATKFVKFADIPQVPVSSVTNTNLDSNGYLGFFAVPLGPATPAMFLNTNAVQSDPQNPGETNLLVNLDDDQTLSGGMPEVGLAYRYVVDPSVTRLEIQGTEDGNNLPPLQIVATNNPVLTNIVLTADNPAQEGRLVYLHFHGSGGAPLSLSAANVTISGWRLAISAKGSDVNLGDLVSENVFLVGGIRTDGEVQPSEGAPVEYEEDPQGLDFIADQMMWLEDYKTP